MTVKVLVPTPLQKFTNDQSTIECEAADVAKLIDALEGSYPGIKARLCDESGKPRRFLKGTETALSDGDEVSIVPAVAGG